MVDGEEELIPEALKYGIGLLVHPLYVYYTRCMSCGANTPLSPTATSVDVERTFSRGCRLLTHVHSHLGAQTMHATLCLGDWVCWDLVSSKDICTVVWMDEVTADAAENDYEMEDGWDCIRAVLGGRTTAPKAAHRLIHR